VTLEFADPALTGGASRPVEPLFGAHYLTIMRLCMRQLGDRNDAEDATQETFRRAYQQRHYVVGDALPWLLTVARNVCVDELRRRNSNRGALERTVALRAVRVEPETIDGEGNPERVVVGRMFVGELLGQLTPAERRVVAGRVLSDESGGEAASAMGITASTTRVLFARAREKLRRYLENGQSVLGVVGLTGWRTIRGVRRRALERSWALQPRSELLLPALAVSALLGGTGGPTAAQAVAPVGAERPAGMAPALDGTAGRPGGVAPGAVSARAVALAAPTSARPAPAVTPQAPQAPVGLLAPPDPYQFTATDFQPSPDYSHDHTLLMVGWGSNGCAGCQQIFRSTDGGAGWTYVGGSGLQSDHIYLPPGSAALTHFYAAGNNVLQVTNDGGNTFQTLLPQAGMTSAAPTWLGTQLVQADLTMSFIGSTGVPQVVAAFGATRLAASAPVVLPSPGGFTAFEAVQDYVLGGPDTLLQCTAGGCVTRAQLPVSGPVQIFPAPDYATSHTLAVVGGGVAVSHDGGATFQLVSTEAVSDASLIAGPSGPRLVAVDAPQAGRPVTTLAYSDDLGATWHQAGISPSANAGTTVHTPRLLRAGRLIAWAADARLVGRGIYICSANGERWSRCTADGA
jgi:RNA polymerase sigma-70 factor (ECF subfamily)